MDERAVRSGKWARISSRIGLYIYVSLKERTTQCRPRSADCAQCAESERSTIPEKPRGAELAPRNDE
jgi:hypothetical protein